MTDTTNSTGASPAFTPLNDDVRAGEKPRLAGRMGPVALILTVLAFSAPMAVVQGFIPFTILFGGPGATLAFFLTTLVLLLFSVGYVAMATHVPKPGDFYAFISSGLGNVVGLGAAFLAVVAYLALLGGTYIFLGINVSSFISSLGGAESSWWLWTIIGWAAVSTLGYFHIELSAKILSIAMLIEIAIVMVFNVAVLYAGGSEGLSSTPFSPSSLAAGDMGVTMLYTILVFLGFEATALFRDEVRDPNRTIPRATYGAVIFVGVLYTLSCYTLTEAYGSQAWEVAKANPTSMFTVAIGKFVSPIAQQIAYCSVILSVFAALISVHNVLSRYVLNLAVDKALPPYLAKVHQRHSSPHTASNAVAMVAALFVAPFILMKAGGSTEYAIATGIGGVGVIALMAMVSCAVVAWFGRNGVPAGENLFKVFIAPAAAALIMFVTVIFAVAHLDLVVGGAPGENLWVIWFLIVAFVSGCMLAVYFRVARPEVYSGLGRADRVFEFLAHKREQAASKQ
ncbi:amino acid/polyamine transporter protein (plasmid) [Rhizobium etli]|uniref:Amino acid/polyamine transporter protein n=1 Tax=Rhizobium etli TaxID=29449 RepID=A0AAN1BNN9_RHIET|nr:APC family permease [Rhizobium etli]ARQ13831.1 amino acid/polyamine transporter protein [Rhizobium etli]